MSLKFVDLDIKTINPELGTSVRTLIESKLNTLDCTDDLVYIIKVHAPDNMSVSLLPPLVEQLNSIFATKLKDKYVIVPCCKSVGIQDITLTKVEVTHEFNNSAETTTT